MSELELFMTRGDSILSISAAGLYLSSLDWQRKGDGRKGAFFARGDVKNPYNRGRAGSVESTFVGCGVFFFFFLPREVKTKRPRRCRCCRNATCSLFLFQFCDPADVLASLETSKKKLVETIALARGGSRARASPRQ